MFASRDAGRHARCLIAGLRHHGSGQRPYQTRPLFIAHYTLPRPVDPISLYAMPSLKKLSYVVRPSAMRKQGNYKF